MSTEVGWFGTVVESITDSGNIMYTLEPELLIYPQLVTGATVGTDDTNDAYDNWYISQLRQGKRLMWHGHSHCNMTTSPSGTDRGLRNQLNADGGAHIYTIHNKYGSTDLEVFDGAEESVAWIHNGNGECHEDILCQLHNVKKAQPVVTSYAPGKYGGLGTAYGTYGAGGYNYAHNYAGPTQRWDSVKKMWVEDPEEEEYVLLTGSEEPATRFSEATTLVQQLIDSGMDKDEAEHLVLEEFDEHMSADERAEAEQLMFEEELEQRWKGTRVPIQ